MRLQEWRSLAIGVLIMVSPTAAVAQDELDQLLQPETTERKGAEEPDREETGEAPSGSEDRTGPAERQPAQAVTQSEPAPARDGAADTRSPGRRRVIEEIIVTAQKREESLRDVPISMSVLGEEFIQQQSITGLDDAARFIPNAKITTEGQQIDIRIRGFGKLLPFNKASEPVVGLVFDGVPYPRLPYFQGPMFDVDRIEALRGPQGTLFGKNNSAGLLNVTTRDPTGELTGFADIQIGELGRQRFEGGVGGPIVEGLVNFRLAALSDERDGILENTTSAVVPVAPDRLFPRDRQGFRGKLRLPDFLGAEVTLSYERIDIENGGFNGEIRFAAEGVQELSRQFDPNADFEPGNYVASIDEPETGNQSIDTFVADASYDWAGWGFDAVVGHSILRSEAVYDGDATPVPSILVATEDDNPQTTVELRASSPLLAGFFGLERLLGWGLGTTDFTTGLFFQRRKIEDSAFTLAFNTAGTAALNGAGMTTEGGGLFGIGSLPPIDGGSIQDITREGHPNESTTMFFEQDSNAFAGFGQMNWRFFPGWSLLFGARFSHETKDALFNRVNDTGPFVVASGFEEFTRNLSRSESQFSPKVGLSYDWTDDINFFATRAVGFRGGGFNEFASAAPNRETLVFDSERAVSWDLGTRLGLLGGAANLNFTLFHMTVTDFQVVTETPQPTGGAGIVFDVQNAPEAMARGFEADFKWLPTGWLTLQGALGFNDSEFVDFPFATCPRGEENFDGDDDPRCDVSGESLMLAPKWAATLVPSVRVPLVSIPGLRALPEYLRDVDLVSDLTIEYEDVHFIRETVDRTARQPSYFRFDGSLGLGNRAQGWRLAVTVENMTDEVVATRVNNLPPNTLQQIVDPPRLVFGEFRLSF